jgi:hypothetical protein
MKQAKKDALIKKYKIDVNAVRWTAGNASYCDLDLFLSWVIDLETWNVNFAVTNHQEQVLVDGRMVVGI